MYRPLSPCPGCARHVRVDDGRCPFCGAAFTALASRVVPKGAGRLSRAASLTLAATLATACGSTVTGTQNQSDAADVVDANDGAPDDNGNLGDVYGTPPDRPVVTDAGPPTDDGGIAALYGDPPPDAGPDDDGGTQAEYGGPPPKDAGPPDDGSVEADYGAPPPRDAGPDDDGSSVDLYGAPPPLDGGL